MLDTINPRCPVVFIDSLSYTRLSILVVVAADDLGIAFYVVEMPSMLDSQETTKFQQKKFLSKIGNFFNANGLTVVYMRANVEIEPRTMQATCHPFFWDCEILSAIKSKSIISPPHWSTPTR